MVGLFLGLTAPLLLPRASISLTAFHESSSATSPKTTCLPSSQEVTTVVMKNWEPFLYENCQPASWWVKVEGHENSRVGASVGHGEDTRLGVLVSPVLIGELVAVD